MISPNNVCGEGDGTGLGDGSTLGDGDGEGLGLCEGEGLAPIGSGLAAVIGLELPVNK